MLPSITSAHADLLSVDALAADESIVTTATHLLEHIAAAARARGIARLHADVPAVNAPMLHVINDSGSVARTAAASEVREVCSTPGSL